MDQGESWHPIQLPPVDNPGRLLVLPESVSMVSPSHRQWRISDLTESWSSLSTPVSDDFIYLPGHYYYDNGDGLLKRFSTARDFEDASYYSCRQISYDFGVTWDTVMDEDFWPYRHFLVYATDKDTVIMSRNSGYQLYVSRNRGESFDIIDQPVGENSDDFSYSEVFGIVYVGDNGVYYQLDEGSEWLNTSFPGVEIDNKRSHVVYGNTIYLLNRDQSYYYTMEHGWTETGRLSEDIQPEPYECSSDLVALEVAGQLNLLVRARKTLEVGYDYSLFKSWDHGENWHVLEIENSAGGYDFYPGSLIHDPYRDVIWTNFSNGLYYAPIDEVGVGEEPITFYPSNHLLVDAYPNPFNSHTTIRYSLPGAGQVTAALYTLEGRLVETLFTGEQQAGQHTLPVNGSALSSGTYFLRLDTPNGQKTQKLVLTK